MIDITFTTLSRKWFRSDSLWTSPILYRQPFKKIPFLLDTLGLMHSQYWPREKLEKLQDIRLQDLAMNATRAPFWQRALAAARINPGSITRADIARLPVTSKKIFSDMPLEEYTDAKTRNGFWFDHTSGSTGRPFRFVHDVHYELGLYAICERMYRVSGSGKRYPLITMRPRWRPGVLMTNGDFFHIKGYNSVSYRFDAFIELASKYSEGFLLHGFGSPLVQLAHLAKERGITLPIRGIVVSAEGLSQSQRAHIENAFHTNLFISYSSRELGFLGFECDHKRIHINEEWAYIEIVDASGQSLEDGIKGKIIVTAFDNRVMPFIRYDTGDLGVIDASACPCGRGLRTISVIGRSVETITLSGGRTVSLLEIAGAFDVFWGSVRQYQIVQVDPDAFDIKIVPADDFENNRDRLEAKLLGLLDPRVRIRWILVDSIPEGPGGKAAYFVRGQAS